MDTATAPVAGTARIGQAGYEAGGRAARRRRLFRVARAAHKNEVAREPSLAATLSEDFDSVAPLMRASALAIVAFEIGFTLLDAVQNRHIFAKIAPYHFGCMALGLMAIAITLSPRAMEKWREIALGICALILAFTARIGVITGDGNALVASIILSFVGSGALVPWSPRWQAAFNSSGALALLGYSLKTPNPTSHLALGWMMLVSASILSQLSSAHSARSRRKLADQLGELEQNANVLRAIFDVSPDAISVADLDGKFVAVNAEYLRLNGRTLEQTIGKSDLELDVWSRPSDRNRLSAALAAGGKIRNMEIEFLTRDHMPIPTLVSAATIEVGHEPCVVAYVRDITARKQDERELVAAREAALAASRAKSEFLSSMSHEIRTPMNAILGMAELLTETQMNDEQRRYLSTVLNNSHSLLKLIDGILDLAQVESGLISLEKVEFDVREVTENVLETMAIRAHEKGIELMARFGPQVPEVALGDPLRLSQILINLAGNAIKFTEKGQVIVTVEHDPESNAACGLRFAVSDTGIGIAADKLQILFNAFSQADSSNTRKFGGSGLGLAIVARLVALMHGRVGVESKPGVGSTFSFTAQFGAIDSNAKLRDWGLRGAKVMIVDSNADARAITAKLLTAQGASVTEVSEAAQALVQIRCDVSPTPRFQLVLLDGTIEGGWREVAAQIMRDKPGLPVVMMLRTDHLTSELEQLHALGVDNYIVKPVRRRDLFTAVARACRGGTAELDDDVLATAPATPARPSAILDRPLRILLADDSEDNRSLIHAYLKKTPYRLDEALDGQEAINKFMSGNYDLVLMDIQMPIVDGFEATATIRSWERTQNRHRTPILALTASALGDAVRRTKEVGCDAHVSKPVSKQTLLDAIRDAVEKKSARNDSVDVSDVKEETCPTG